VKSLNRLRILLVVDDYGRIDSYGGGDIIAQTLCAGLRGRGHQVDVACCQSAVSAMSADRRIHKTFTAKCIWRRATLARMLVITLADLGRWGVLLRRVRPHVVYCLHQSGLSIPAITAINRTAVPKVYRFGHEWVRLHYYADKCVWTRFWERRWGGWLLGAAHAGSRRILSYLVPTTRRRLAIEQAVFNSHDLVERYRRFLSPATRCYVLPNAVDTRVFTQHPRGNDRPRRLVFVGRLVPHKGVHTLIRAFALLRDEEGTRDLTLTIVGASTNNVCVKGLRALAMELAVSDSIEWVGGVHHLGVAKYLHDSDLFVFPSTTRGPGVTVEGCPSALLEAMAVGLPVVARLGPGVDEVVRDGETCVGVRSDLPRDLADAIRLAIDSQGLRRLIVANGLRAVQRNHSLDGMLDATERVLIRAAAENRAPRATE